MDENENTDIAPKSTFFGIAVCESILAVIIIAAALILKFFFPAAYEDVKTEYDKTVAVDTEINEIINGANDEIQAF